MSNKKDAVKEFEQYAEAELKNHMDELNTRYEDKQIDKQTLQKGYHKHREIYNNELEEKIKSLSSAENNSWLKGELENLKSTYLSKLILNS